MTEGPRRAQPRRRARRTQRRGDAGDTGHSGVEPAARQPLSAPAWAAQRAALGAAGRPAPRDRAAAARRSARSTPAMMDLLRRLAQAEPACCRLDTAGSNGTARSSGHGGSAAPNLIRANREELRQASRGSLDHMVIDVIGSLFDQILSDPKVPPQLARQIARLQLPVLRAALGDPASSRRASTRCGSSSTASRRWATASTTSATSRRSLPGQGARPGAGDRQGRLRPDRDLRVQAGGARGLRRRAGAHCRETQQATAPPRCCSSARKTRCAWAGTVRAAARASCSRWPAPAFVRDFVSRVWSRVILKAAEREGVTSERVRALRQTGRELFMSVQPKTSPAQRKAFLAELPKLMQQINEG
jgi:hypothetical protein